MGNAAADPSLNKVEPTGESGARPLVAVVGYDGTEPSRRALDAATNLLRGRRGEVDVVYVAHVPGVAVLSAEGVTEIRGALDEETDQLSDEVRRRLSGTSLRWRFERRDGVADVELMAVAAELRDRYRGEAEIVIVVGGPTSWRHHLAGSVGTSIARRDRFPVVVVPSASTSAPAWSDSDGASVPTAPLRVVSDGTGVSASEPWARGRALAEVRGRLSAIEHALAGVDHGADELRRDADELEAVVRRLDSLADAVAS